MRQIEEAIIHCSASDNPHHDSINIIRDWHLERGFKDVGYHFFIKGNGSIEIGRDISIPGAHCEGHNKFSIGICLHGNVSFSEQQFKSCARLLTMLRSLWPHIKIYPHNEYNRAKTCPNFPIEKVYPFV